MLVRRSMGPAAFPIDLLNAPVHSLGVNASTPVWRTLAGLRAFRQAPLLSRLRLCHFSGFNAPAAVHQRMAQRSILYCHALPRFAYDLETSIPRSYRAGNALHSRPSIRSFAISLNGPFIRWTSHSPTPSMYNDGCTFLGLSATVLNPPVPNHRFHWEPDQGYFLSTAR